MSDVDWDDVSCVVSDVDETLIADKSMISFLGDLAEVAPQLSAVDVVARMQRQPSREAANRVYYAALAGLPEQLLSQVGTAWFTRRQARQGFWIAPTLAVLREAGRRGIPVLLVSGSHHACLTPVAHHLGATSVLCTELEVVDGALTGARLRTAIGVAKAERVLDEARRCGLDLSRAVGMGDHQSDYPFLRLCGQALLVRDLTELHRLEPRSLGV